VIFKDKFAGNKAQPDGLRTLAELHPELDLELDEALTNFRLSVHAWSEAAFSRQRTAVAAVAPRRVWRLALGWALGCVLVAGGASAGVWEHHQREIRSAAARMAEQQRLHEQLVAQQRDQQARQEEEDLLAKVDSDVSREIPAAMEPLAQLMVEDDTP
jgi:phosphoketolase